jgi:hypothetical protein
MMGGAIPTTGRRAINPAWESISLRTQPDPLRCALALRVDGSDQPTNQTHCNEVPVACRWLTTGVAA